MGFCGPAVFSQPGALRAAEALEREFPADFFASALSARQGVDAKAPCSSSAAAAT